MSTTSLRISYPPPVLMLVLSYLVEWYGLLVNAVPFLDRFLSEPGEPTRWVQPGVYATSLNYFVDDKDARRRPEDGGFGYMACCTTVGGCVLRLWIGTSGLRRRRWRWRRGERRRKSWNSRHS